MKIRPLAWFQSLHAKLFTVTALVTSLLTVAIAWSITNNSRRELLRYTKSLAIDTSEAVETEIVQRWDKEFHDFKEPRKIEELLESLAGPDRSIFQIDVFRREPHGGASLVVSSGDESTITYGPDIGSYMNATGAVAEEVSLTTGSSAWKVYLPIRPKANRAPVGLIRTYCDLERWETVWRNNLRATYWKLPLALLGEFILLWVILGTVVSDPLRRIMDAMARLEKDPAARLDLSRRDELGLIADRFNFMAAELERSALDRERLIGEIRAFNAGLQARIDEALSELQAKNQELEQLVERNALLREELSQQERLAVAGQLTAAFAHEVGTPLNLVNSHIQLLQAQGDLPERARDRLGVIHAQIDRVGDIVRKLLGITRRPTLQAQVLDARAMVEDLQRLWSPTLVAHHVAFELQVPSPCPLRVDRKQMEQLFINLVNNAVDAMPGGGRITLAMTPDPAAPEGGPRWRVALSDTGAGIPRENLAKVFKPMFTTKPEGKGTGLGLAICREIVKAHGSEIALESEEGRGTTVTFSLPGVANP